MFAENLSHLFYCFLLKLVLTSWAQMQLNSLSFVDFRYLPTSHFCFIKTLQGLGGGTCFTPSRVIFDKYLWNGTFVLKLCHFSQEIKDRTLNQNGKYRP